MGHGWDAGGTKRGARKGRRARTTPSGYWPLTARPLVLSHGDGSVPPNGIGPPRGHLFGDELDGPGLGQLCYARGSATVWVSSVSPAGVANVTVSVRREGLGAEGSSVFCAVLADARTANM